jgi:hypothetical protein
MVNQRISDEEIERGPPGDESDEDRRRGIIGVEGESVPADRNVGSRPNADGDRSP